MYTCSCPQAIRFRSASQFSGAVREHVHCTDLRGRDAGIDGKLCGLCGGLTENKTANSKSKKCLRSVKSVLMIAINQTRGSVAPGGHQALVGLPVARPEPLRPCSTLSPLGSARAFEARKSREVFTLSCNTNADAEQMKMRPLLEYCFHCRMAPNSLRKTL